MSAFLACKNSPLDMSPSAKESPYDSAGTILKQSDFLSHDRGQILGSDLNLTEMSEGEYTHLQHLIQTHMETQANLSDMPPDRSDQDTGMIKDTTVMSPLSATQAIDLSTSSDGHDFILPGEKTPPSYGEVPGFVLARIRGEDSLAGPPDNTSMSSQSRSHSTARVCLEKRFNSTSSKQQDLQSAVFSNFLTIVQQTSETENASTHPQLQKWLNSDRRNEMPDPYIGISNPGTNICGQVIGQISHLETNTHKGLIIPKGFPLNLCPERVPANVHFASASNRSKDERTSLPAPKTHDIAHHAKTRTSKVALNSAGESGSSAQNRAQQVVSLSQRRERHNCKERERRRRIRLSCDELNMLVPFCQTDTDKVTTLQWTTAYLRYITKVHGDTLKEEFQKSFTDQNGLKLNPSSDEDQIHQDMEENLDIPLAVKP